MNKNYDVDYFIRKFEAIPEKKWIGFDSLGRGINPNRTCAMGHCGGYTSDSVESKSLSDILRPLYKSIHVESDNAVVFRINDGPELYQQPTPKQRILAALYDIKKMNSDKEEERSVASKEQSELLQSETKRKNITKSLAVFPVEEKSDLKTLNEVV